MWNISAGLLKTKPVFLRVNTQKAEINKTKHQIAVNRIILKWNKGPDNELKIRGVLKMKKILFVIFAFCIAIPGLFAAGQAEGQEKQVTIKMVTWDSVMFEYMTVTNSMSELYRESHPNVTIEIEKSKDSESYEQTMQIRAAAGELPDVILLKPYMLEKFKEFLSPMDEHPITAKNKFASMYSIDGSILGLPMASFNEFVYYRKSIFNELGLTVPETGGEYLTLLEQVKKDGRYIPLAMGLKDAWPVYPFNEYMPLLESGDGNYYNEMAGMNQPFSTGKPFNSAYRKIQDMMKMEVMGSDPLGMGWDQSKAQFAAGEAAMLAAGQWFISDYVDNLGGDVDDLGIFFLPTRDKSSDPFYATVMADTFFGIPSNCKNSSEASEFIRWFFDVYYEQLLPSIGVSSTIEGLEVTGNPILEQVADLEKPEFILVEADGTDFTEIKNSIQFDVKKIGQEMYVNSYGSFNDLMETLNEKWSDAQN
jgi:raffinose/stachyose/melibiose transport system substrate-binding protein